MKQSRQVRRGGSRVAGFFGPFPQRGHRRTDKSSLLEEAGKAAENKEPGIPLWGRLKGILAEP